MKSKLIPILIANLFAASSAAAADGDDTVNYFGLVGVGGLITNESAGTRDAAKLNEYRDLENGAIVNFDIKGRSSDYYLDGYGENLGRDDQYLDLKGGKYTIFKYQFFANDIVHNWAFDARTPYSGIGTDTLTATFPSLSTTNWNTFDLQQKREDIGGMFELSNDSPWYFRVDTNQVTDKGLKLIAGANGTSPGNGFTDKPLPVDTTTQNVAVEGGYATKQGQLSVNASYSKFSNRNDLLHWTNGFFANGLDTTTLAADSDYAKLGANGVLKALPLGSTLAGRLTYSTTANSSPIATTALNTGGVFGATNPDRSAFDGDIVHQTASLSLHSNPTREIDSRVYWNWFKKDNHSPIVTFTGLPVGLTCGRIVQGATVIDPGDCTTETLSYTKNNFGVDVGYRFNPQNRLVLGFDYVDLKRNRIDFDKTEDKKASIEYKNTSLDQLSARVKYQYLQRRSHFLESAAGADANDPEFLNRFIARFDASDVDQNLIKLVLDANPAELWDLSVEGIFKHNDYKNTVLGRTKDTRQQFYASVGYGDMNAFRVMAFADVEFIQYDSYHRNISTVSSGTGVGINSSQSGNCQTTFPNCYDPNTPANNSNYNWAATNKDRNWAVGLGADWAATQRLKLHSSLLWQWTHGTADFAVQSGATPTTPSVPIDNYDNTRKLSFNLKGTYAFSKAWELTGGYAFEKFYFNDISYNGYQYTIGTGASASYLSGAYAFPDYIVNAVYVVGTYKFE